MALTPKQEAFCREYILCDNATEAYIRAYNWNGERNNARIEASLLMDNPNISLTIKELREAKTEEFIFTKEKAFDKYERIYNAGMDELANLPTAKSAVDGQCKLYGLHEDKITVKTDRQLFEEELITAMKTSETTEEEEIE